MKKKLGLILAVLALVVLPMAAFAQVSTVGATSTGCNTQTLGGWLCTIGSLLNKVVPVLIALGVVYFVWGVISFVIADDEEAKTKGKDRIIWGIIGLAVIIGMWGLVAVLRNTFGINNTQIIELPTIPVVLP